MITEMITATAGDLTQLLKEEDFLRGSAKTRQGILEKNFGQNYPQALTDYMTSMSVEGLMNDLLELAPYLGKKESILTELGDLKDNALLKAFIESGRNDLIIQRDANLGEKSLLIKYQMDLLEKNVLSGLAKRSLIREIQTLLSMWDGTNSPVVQIAEEVSSEIKEDLMKKIKTNGIVQILVNSELMGGMRIFSDDGLIDSSWRAKLNKFFTALR